MDTFFPGSDGPRRQGCDLARSLVARGYASWSEVFLVSAIEQDIARETLDCADIHAVFVGTIGSPEEFRTELDYARRVPFYVREH